MRCKKAKQSNATIRKATLEIVEAFMQSGEEEITIRPITNEGRKRVSISSPLNEEISDSVLDKVAILCKNISWCVSKNDCDELCIVLHNEPDAQESDTTEAK